MFALNDGPVSDEWFHRIKSATRDLVRKCGGVVRAGEVAHASKSEVSRWQSAADGDLIDICAVLALEAECGLPLVTTVMADLNGRRLAEPQEGEGDAVSVATQHAAAMRAAAELMAQGAKAFADGKLTPAEAELMNRAAAETLQAILTLQGQLAGVKAAAAGKARRRC